MYVTIFAATLVLVIMFHEFGHYATAKLFGMKVDRFFLGFGPTLWSFQRGETEYGVKAIPAGGFVRIVGMTAAEDVDPADEQRTFRAKPAWQKLVVLITGSATHFLVAAALIFAALALVGLPIASNVVDRVVAGSPAAGAGLRPGDRIVAVDGVPTPDFDAIVAALQGRGGQTLTVGVERSGVRREVSATLAERLPDGSPGAFLGVGPAAGSRPVGAGEALLGTVRGDLSIFNIAWQNLRGLGQVFSPTALSEWFGQVDDPGPRNADGPLSLVGVGQAVNALGTAGDVFSVLLLLALLNITLGTLNMLPLPPLDGGHVAVLLIEEGVNGVRRLRGRSASWRLDPSIITPVALAVILFFVVLSLTALYVDIAKPASDLLQQ